MPSGAIQVGRIAGIPIGVHPLWLVIVVLLTAALGADYYPDEVPGIADEAAYALGLLSVLTLFAGIVGHEFGHALVARRHGVEIEEIDLWLLGGVARMANEPQAAKAELRFALAGPAVTAALLAVAIGVRAGGGDALAGWLQAFLEYQVLVNAAILVFNMLPAFPLDGGRVLRSLLWQRSGDRETATTQAAAVGRACGWGFVALGFVGAIGGSVAALWLALVGGFVILAAKAESQRAVLRRSLGDVKVADLMTPEPVTLRAADSVAESINGTISRHLYTAYPVIGPDGRVTGLLTLDRVRALPDPERRHRLTGEMALTGPEVLAAPGDEVVDVVTTAGFLRAGRAVVADEQGRVLGLLSTTDVSRRAELGELLGVGPRPERPVA